MDLDEFETFQSILNKYFSKQIPASVYRIELELRPISYRFQTGHKIAVYVSSSNFPRLARNLNTGGDPHLSIIPVVATNRVYYSGNQNSHIELPVTQ
jgi:predicted acyl esterase